MQLKISRAIGMRRTKLVLVDLRHVPTIDDGRFAAYPRSYIDGMGYASSSACRMETNVNGPKHDKLYWQCKGRMEGKDMVARNDKSPAAAAR
ncbi:hypothetical protein PABG_11122 [Paracoccidioides brasiliensis Pb03]|nr:hypothetical protein PABG_11122 [Paracoccidioides brasiliensis Pb03]